MAMNTIEMISKIKKGVIVKCLDTYESNYGAYMDEDGSIKWLDKNKNKTEDCVELTGLVLHEYTWEFEFKEIDVVEAVKIIKDGGVATCVSSYGVYVYGGDSTSDTLSINAEIINGKWYKGDVSGLL
jgi:hypothetical protein